MDVVSVGVAGIRCICVCVYIYTHIPDVCIWVYVPVLAEGRIREMVNPGESTSTDSIAPKLGQTQTRC